MEQRKSPSTFWRYAGRVLRQFYRDIRQEVATTVSALVAILIVLFVQFRMDWIKEGEGLATVFTNIAPSLVIFLTYIGYHFVRAPYELDKQRADRIRGLGEVLREAQTSLEKERAKNERPEFIGEIKDIHLDDQLRLDREPTGVEIYITVEARIANNRAEGTIQECILSLRVGEEEIEGQRMKLDGFYAVRENLITNAWGSSTEELFIPLNDLEKENQVSLKANFHRSGWLRFMFFFPVTNRKNSQEELPTLRLRRQLKEDAEIALTVIDGRGEPHQPIIRKAPLESTVDIRKPKLTAY